MNALDAVKAGVLLFLVAIVQVSLLSSVDVVGGVPNLLLVTIVVGRAAARLDLRRRGRLLRRAARRHREPRDARADARSILTVGGYWIGRYGETTGRDRTHAPFVSVAVVTVLYAVGVLVLHFLLGDPVSAQADPARVAASRRSRST